MRERDMTGLSVVITGANSGIGKATAAALATRGARILLACRNLERARQARTYIAAATPSATIDLVQLDLADLQSVGRAVGEITGLVDSLDVLVNNAGATFITRSITSEGFERTFATNFLGHYALTRLLLPTLQAAEGPRVISVSSDGHKFTRSIRWDDLTWENGRYTPWLTYANAKLAQVLFTTELARRYGSAGLFAAAVHPGVIGSDFYGNAIRGPFANTINTVMGRFAKSSEQGAETSIHLSCAPAPLELNGAYWAKGRPARPSRAARDTAAAERLWYVSDDLVRRAGLDLGIDSSR